MKMKCLLTIFLIVPLFAHTQTTCSSGGNTIIIEAIVNSNIDCNGQCTGAATVSVSGGSGNYVFDWSGPLSYSSSLQSITGLCEGTYAVTVEDLTLGIICTDQVTITQPLPFLVSLSTTNCSSFGTCDGSASLTISGGTPPYSIQWYDSFMTVIPGQTLPNISNLCAGTYYYSIADASNCYSNSGPGLVQFNISEPPALSIVGSFGSTQCASDYNPYCTGMISTFASGGTPPYMFYLSGGASGSNSSGDFHSLCVGGYTVTVVDNAGQSESISGVVGSLYPFLALIANESPASCTTVCDGEIALTVSGGTAPYLYSITGISPFQQNNTFLGICSGQLYTPIVSDSYGCKNNVFSYNFATTAPIGLVVDSVAHETMFAANDGSVWTHTTNPNATDFTLNGGNLQSTGNYTGLMPGNYTICAHTSASCSECLSFSITPVTCDLLVSESQENVTCHGYCDGTINLIITGNNGPYGVLWNTSQTDENLINLCPNSYSYEVTDSMGCVFSGSFDIEEPQELEILFSFSDASSISNNDGVINISGMGGVAPYNYSIDGGTNWLPLGSFDSLFIGTYPICIGDVAGCITCDTVVISAPSKLQHPDNAKISVYPIPATHFIHIQSKDKIAEINIFDLSGKLVLSKIFSAPDNLVRIDVGNLPNSVYFISVATTRQEHSRLKISVMR